MYISLSEIRNKEKQLNFLKKSLLTENRKLPEGRLRATTSGVTPQYFYKTNKEQEKWLYIRKKDRNLAIQIAQKEYNLKLITKIDKELTRLKVLSKHLKEYKLEEVYESLPSGRKRIVTPRVKSKEEIIQDWLDQPFSGKAFDVNSPEIFSDMGIRVRSKSEKMIADKLEKMGIPYKYECPLILNGYGTIFPDFTLFDVERNKQIYLEHFGMMNNPEYAEKAIRKIDLFEKNGYILGIDLLATFETANYPINMRSFEMMIMNLFQMG